MGCPPLCTLKRLHGDRRNKGAPRACAAGAGGHARTRWSTAGPLIVQTARIRRAQLCRSRSPAGLVFPLRPILLGSQPPCDVRFIMIWRGFGSAALWGRARRGLGAVRGRGGRLRGRWSFSPAGFRRAGRAAVAPITVLALASHALGRGTVPRRSRNPQHQAG